MLRDAWAEITRLDGAFGYDLCTHGHFCGASVKTSNPSAYGPLLHAQSCCGCVLRAEMLDQLVKGIIHDSPPI
nr:MAG TPA: hypothetical protein [Caudoviricetes sp.]DAK77153.1 MAG TPA: hypothetical protein [Caudoviricetes sp.]